MMATDRLVIKGDPDLLSATSALPTILDRVAYVLAAAAADGRRRSVGGISRDTGLDTATVLSALQANPDVFQRSERRIGGSEFYGLRDGVKPRDSYEPHDADTTPVDAPSHTRTDGGDSTTGHVPLRNRNFTGREEILTALHNALHEDDRAALTQTGAIHGLGGIGKTQIAAEYAHRYDDEYDTVWWVAAEDASSRQTGYVALAQRLDLPEKDAQDPTVTVAAVREWLRQNDRWLLILDNAPDADAVADLLPDGKSGHVVITSRSAAWRDTARPLPVDTWPRDESVAFLRARTGDEGDAADTLAAELGDLPLALEQAAAYMDAAGMSYDAYLETYRENPAEAMATAAPRAHPDPVARTWAMSMKRLREESPEAADLLNLCAFLAPDDIPRAMIADGAEHLPQPLASVVGSVSAMGSVTAALRQYSLMTVDGDALSVHRLVQQVVRDGMDAEARQRWWECAVRLIAEALPTGIQTDPGIWPTCARLLPHVRVVTETGTEPGSAADAFGDILNGAATYLYVRAQFGEAADILRQAVQVGEDAHGPTHPTVATHVNNLGSVLEAQGDLDGAKECFQRALTIHEAAYGPDHPNVAIRVNSLGSVLEAQGDLDGAKERYQRALSIDEAAYGPDHPDVASDLNSLGLVLQAQGDLDGAQERFHRALTIDEAAYGPDHPAVAIDANNLGSVHFRLDDVDAALDCLQRALRIWTKFLGVEHPHTVLAQRNLDAVRSAMRG